MGHRHRVSSSQVFESEHDQNWNLTQTDQTWATRSESSENGSLFYPMESIFSDGINFSPHWNPLPRSNEFSSSTQIADVPPFYPEDVSGQSHDPFQQHTVSTENFSSVSENYAHRASSSSFVEANFVDLSMGNGRGSHKRKSPVVPSSCELGSSSSRYHGTGSSSELPIMPLELRNEKVGLDSQHCVAAINPGYIRGNGLSIRAGGESTRNVRSRSTPDLSSSSLLNSSYTTNLDGHQTPMDISGQPSAGLTLEWDHFVMPSHGNNILAPDSNNSSHDPTRFLLGNNFINEGFHQEIVQNPRNSVPPSYPGSVSSVHTARGFRSSCSQRPNPSFRASSSSAGFRLGHPEEGLHWAAESHSRQTRPLSSVGWRNGDRSGRLRISQDRFRLHSDETTHHDRFASEGFMLVERSGAYGSRNSLDQHREMRLDVDNMSYEELLALGERIGTVSTGVSADSMSKCVTETIYCSSDQLHDEETCAICLEEYKNMDDVGTLKSCGHDYHVYCIKKWLQMKNLCPICKRPALADDRFKGK